MNDTSQTAEFWQQAADTFQQIVADGGDPKTDPMFGGNDRVLETVRAIVESRSGPANEEINMTNEITVSTDELIRRKLIDAEIPGAIVEFDPDEAERAGAFVEDAMSEADARDAEDGLPIEPATPAKLSLFAAARSA